MNERNEMNLCILVATFEARIFNRKTQKLELIHANVRVRNDACFFGRSDKKMRTCQPKDFVGWFQARCEKLEEQGFVEI